MACPRAEIERRGLVLLSTFPRVLRAIGDPRASSGDHSWGDLGRDDSEARGPIVLEYVCKLTCIVEIKMQREWPFQNHSNEQLIDELRSHRANELESCVRVLRILGEVDRRTLYADLGYPSLYQFCVSVLHLSEHEAYARMKGARAAAQFPVIFEMMERGEVHLTAVRLLAPHLTEENHRSLLHAAIHKTKREVEELLAARFPRAAVTESIRRLQAPSLSPTSSASPALLLSLLATPSPGQ